MLFRSLVRYADLRPCTTAFVDARTPGSDRKENFTIIGPGVAENPEQHVHITVPHGFNIGAARQPPRCVNSQHSHDTAEVFIVHTGRWRFTTGHDARDGSVEMGPGDTISIPIHTFRGFENIGEDLGFMFAVLGGDDPGRVTWAPQVFEMASRHGLVLLANGSLVDTTRQALPADARRMRPTTAADVARFDRYTSAELERCVVRAAALATTAAHEIAAGVREVPIIGAASPAEHLAAGALNWPHGFSVRALLLEPGALTPRCSRAEEEVLLMHSGALSIDWDDQTLALAAGDTLTVSIGLAHAIGNPGSERAVAYVVRRGDRPEPAR